MGPFLLATQAMNCLFALDCVLVIGFGKMQI